MSDWLTVVLLSTRQIRLGTPENENGGDVTKEGLNSQSALSGIRIEETEPLLIPKLEGDYGSTDQNGKRQRKGRWGPRRLLNIN